VPGRRTASSTRRFGAALVAGALAAAASVARAQDLEPRAFANTPVGVNFVLAGYGYSEGGVVSDPSLPLKDASVHVHGAVAAYARAIDVFGKSGKIGVILPYAWASGSAEFAGQRKERVVDGFADPRFRFSVNLYGAPAMSLEEFSRYEQNVIVGTSLQVTAPLGQYDRDKLLNIGTNRWSVKPEVGVSKALGRFTLEAVPGATFFTENTKFLGSRTRAEDPLYSVQGHAIYSFRRGFWGSIDATWYGGGQTTIDGRAGSGRQDNSRVGGTLTVPIDVHHSIKLYASTGATTRIGTSFDTFGIAWQYRWGGGL